MMRSNSSLSFKLWLITVVSLAVAGSHYCTDQCTAPMYVKGKCDVKQLCDKLQPYVQKDGSPAVTIFSLSIILNLHEDMQEFLEQQIFQLLFNVIIVYDNVNTRQYAVDLFADLLQTANIQQSLLQFDCLETSIRNLLSLLTS